MPFVPLELPHKLEHNLSCSLSNCDYEGSFPVNIKCKYTKQNFPTLYSPLRSVDIRTKEPFEVSIERSDVCAVPAASVVAESMLAITLLGAILEMFPADDFRRLKKWFKEYKESLKRF
ncbi:MAG: chorismate synthase [Desulfurobacteriaceae bacterium]